MKLRLIILEQETHVSLNTYRYVSYHSAQKQNTRPHQIMEYSKDLALLIGI